VIWLNPLKANRLRPLTRGMVARCRTRAFSRQLHRLLEELADLLEGWRLT